MNRDQKDRADDRVDEHSVPYLAKLGRLKSRSTTETKTSGVANEAADVARRDRTLGSTDLRVMGMLGSPNHLLVDIGS